MHVAREGKTTVTATARATGLRVPTAHHLLATLVAEGLVARGPGHSYLLGPAIGVLADRFEQMNADAVPSWLMEPLETLARETGETAYLSAWRGDHIQVLASIDGRAAVRVARTETGTYHSAHARATGKLLLAWAQPARRQQALGEGPLPALTPATLTSRNALATEFETIRNRGWAEDREEFTEGVCCLSAPALLDATVLAAYTVSVPVHNFDRRHPDLLNAVRTAAATAVRTQPSDPEDR